MKLLGFELSIKKSAQNVNRSTGWRSLFRWERNPGDWQRGTTSGEKDVMAFFAVYACVSLISNDIGKLRPFIYRTTTDGIKEEQKDHKAAKVLMRPNHYQNHIQFKSTWAISKLSSGNAYGLKQRNANREVEAIYILDPSRVTPLVSDEGEIFYQLDTDNLSGIKESAVVVPASEIIHDRINCLYHPLVGISPLYACSLSAGLGMAIQENSKRYFRNAQRPGGILVAPGPLSADTAKILKDEWAENYGGENYGKTAVVGDGLKFEAMSLTAHDSQLIEQLKLSGEVVCSAFGVPAHMAQVGPPPNYDNAETLVLQYYSQCLQSHIEQFELCISEGLGLRIDRGEGIELDLDALLRMDTATKYKTLTDGIKGTLLTANEARRRINLPPVSGGDSLYMQQQNYSLEALNARDKLPNPFKPGEPIAPSSKDGPEFDYDGDRTFTINGVTFKLPIVIDRGVYDADKEATYERGDSVSHGGSLWIAQVDAPKGKPGETLDWRLSVKRGKAAR